jgi:hypothetical protein
MVASTDIKFYVHTNTNAPQLQNAYGCMIDVLDACLVNGFGSQTVSTLTASGTTVTATFGSAHNFMQYQVIKITGANQAEFNGEHRILTVPNASTITFQLANVPSVTTATGTISCSLPSLGWEKPFSSAGKAAYRSGNTSLPQRPYLRVIDALDPLYNSAYSKYAKVGMVENMTDIDTLVGVQVPYDQSSPDKNWTASGSGASVINGWAKWYYSYCSTSAPFADLFAYSNSPAYSDILGQANGNRPWVLIGTSDYFYILPCTSPTSLRNILGFGRFDTYITGDAFNWFLCASIFYNPANTLNNTALRGQTTAFQGAYNNNLLIQRNIAGTANYITGQLTANKLTMTGQSDVTARYSTLGYSVATTPQIWTENIFRGEIPLLKWVYQAVPRTSMSLFLEDSEIYLPITIGCSINATNQYTGQIFVKVGDL